MTTTANTIALNEVTQQSIRDIFQAFALGWELGENIVYGENGTLGEEDFDHTSIFQLFTDPNKLLEQFVAFNLKHYKDYGKDHGIFINKFHRSIGSPEIYSKYEVRQWVRVYNIPVLVVRTLPWDDPTDDIWIGGNYHHLGILAAEDTDIIDVVEHEIIHAMNFWLRRGKIFQLNRPLTPLQKAFLPHTDLFETVLERFRDESIAYLLSAPGKLGERDFELVVRSLTGRDHQTLIDRLKPQDFQLIEGLCKISKRVDAGSHKISKAEYCKLLMRYSQITELAAKLTEAAQ